MKIVAAETIVVGARMRNWVFVKVTTDEGLVGWGEATTEWRTRSVVGAIADFEPLLIGEDPFRIENVWQSLNRRQYWRGGIVTTSALSGIDQALHDIKAQALGVPILELLGGRVRERIRLYDHLGGGDPDEVYGELSTTRFADAARSSVEAGFEAVKILPVPVGAALASGAALSLAEGVMAAVREAVGPNVEVMVDFHGRCSPAAAIAFGKVLVPYRPWFIEEPCPADCIDALPEIAAATGVPLALGERLVSRVEFEQVMATRAVSVIQPDICHCGGLTEVRKIAAAADTRRIAVAPHNPLGPIATAHNLHVAAATPNWIIQEQMRNAVPWYDEVVSVPLEFVDGYAQVPEAPGLGLAVNEEAAARYPYVPEDQIRTTLDDGSVGDW